MAAGPKRDAGERIEIDTRYAAERWRYVCPRGHIDWRATPDGFVCHACESDGENGAAAEATANGRFAVLLDRRTRERIPRERIRVVETAVAAAYETDGSDSGTTADSADRPASRGRTRPDP